VQVSEIYNHYILNTPNALFDHPLTVVDILNIFRKSLELNLHFVVIVFKDTPHIVLGFYFGADCTRLIERPNLLTGGAFMREDMVNRGLYEVGMARLCRTLGPDFRGFLGFVNFSNRTQIRKQEALFFGDFTSKWVLRKGLYKHGKYHDVAMYYYSPKHALAIGRRLRERL
jgi:hypothetical protein